MAIYLSFQPYYLLDDKIHINYEYIPVPLVNAYEELISGKTAYSIVANNLKLDDEKLNVTLGFSIIKYIEQQGLGECFSYFSRDAKELIRNNETNKYLCTSIESDNTIEFEKSLIKNYCCAYDGFEHDQIVLDTNERQAEFFGVPITADIATMNLLAMVSASEEYKLNLTDLKPKLKPENERVLILISELFKNNQTHVKELPDFNRGWKPDSDLLFNNPDFKAVKKYIYSNPNSVEKLVDGIARSNRAVSENERSLLSIMNKHYDKAVLAVERFEARYGKIESYGSEYPAQLIAFTVFMDRQLNRPSHDVLLSKMDSCFKMAFQSTVLDKFNLDFKQPELEKMLGHLKNKFDGIIEDNSSRLTVNNKQTMRI